jgi:phosphoglycolate phosphatase
MIKAVSFDLDGTLIDATEAIVETFLHTFKVMGAPAPPTESIIRSIGYTLRDQFARLSELDPDECVRVYRDYYQHIAVQKTYLLPGAREALVQLHNAGLRLGFATSKKRDFAEASLENLQVLHFFEARIGPYEVAHPKPHPDALLKTMELLDVTPDELYFVGDTHFDVQAAQNAGVRCVCVTTGYNTREELEALEPEAVLDSILEATGYILAHRLRPTPCSRPPASCGPTPHESM